MGVSKNRGTPKWMVYNGKPYWKGWFGGTTILGNIHIYIYITTIHFTANSSYEAMDSMDSQHSQGTTASAVLQPHPIYLRLQGPSVGKGSCCTRMMSMFPFRQIKGKAGYGRRLFLNDWSYKQQTRGCQWFRMYGIRFNSERGVTVRFKHVSLTYKPWQTKNY